MSMSYNNLCVRGTRSIFWRSKLIINDVYGSDRTVYVTRICNEPLKQV